MAAQSPILASQASCFHQTAMLMPLASHPIKAVPFKHGPQIHTDPGSMLMEGVFMLSGGTAAPYRFGFLIMITSQPIFKVLIRTHQCGESLSPILVELVTLTGFFAHNAL